MMTAEASNVLARRGVDAPRFRMVAFGGAGPLLGALLAEELAIDTILIPPYPGALSALGAARADLEGDLVQPVYEQLHALPSGRLASLLAELEEQAKGWIAAQTARIPAVGVRTALAAEMRYDGQGYDVSVPLDRAWLEAGDTARIASAFHAAHRATYGHANEDARIWMKELRAHVVGAMARPPVASVQEGAGVAARASRPVRLLGKVMQAAVVDRASIGEDETISRPGDHQPDGYDHAGTAGLAGEAGDGGSDGAGERRMMDAVTRQDAISAEVFANLFKAIVDEMAWIVLRSSHTTFVKETQDFAVSLVTKEGEIFAYPYGSGATPIMGVPMHAGTRAFDDWVPGDVMMTNDPYTTGGMVMHLNDIYLFKPVFIDGRLLCFAWTFIHCTDVGGYAPGSIDMRNNEVFQEGLRLRPVKLMRGGVLNQELWTIFADNCRIPGLNWGDVTACLAALDKAEQRLTRLAERYGRGAVDQAIYATLDRTEQLARQVLARIPAGRYSFDEYFEDDYVSDLPVRITATLISQGDGTVTLDFTGIGPAGAGGTEPAHGFDEAPPVPVHGADQPGGDQIGIDPHQCGDHPLHRTGAA